MLSRLGPTALLVVLLAGCGDDSETIDKRAEPKSKVQDAYEACSPVSSPRIELGDNGHTILIDGVKGSVGFEEIACFTQELATPQSIVSQMDSTTAMMGRQHAEADGIKYDWSYHPDNGVNMVITDL